MTAHRARYSPLAAAALVALLCAAPVLAGDTPTTAGTSATMEMPAKASVRALPPMQFYASIGGDTVYDLLKTAPAFARMDKELAGAPFFLVVTHTIRPTAGGNAAGMLSAILSGSTLGIIPVVTNEEFVVRYEIWMHGQPVTTHSFSRTKTRAINIWAGANDKYYGLGKEGLEWLKSTAGEFAKLATSDPALANVQAEIDYYFPQAAEAAASAITAAAPAVPAAPASTVAMPPAPATPVQPAAPASTPAPAGN
ncbi:hypothetical protein [Arenimonas sp.]|uniref:hypothetical protein n=1 Tax=Arenimonas sp. TaxID=1872635 RepID=UPI0039E2FC35